MTNLTPNPGWSAVPEIETNTALLGGPGGPLNTQAQALLNRTEAIAQGVLTDAGATSTWTGAEVVPMSRGAGLLQTTLTKIATFILSIFTILIVSGTGAVARTILAKLIDLPVSVKDFGAKGDGATDDTTAVQNALNFISVSGGRVVIPAGSTCYIAGNLAIPAGAVLEGPYVTPDSMLSMSGSAISVLGLGGAIALNGAATITVNGGAAVRGLLIYRSGIVIPASDASLFAGVAITIGGPGAYVGYSMILGFSKLIYSNGFERPKIEWVFGDGTNGIEITACNDIARISKCHLWPFVTYTPTALASAHQRSGNAYYLHDTVDEPNLDGNFSYGYFNGYYFKNVSTVTAVNCKADGTGSYTGDSGWRFEGNINGFVGAGNATWSHTSGVVANMNATQFADLSNFIYNSNTTCIAMQGGHVRARNCQFMNATTLVSYGLASSLLDLDNNLLANVTNMVSSSVSTSNVKIGASNLNLTSAAGTSLGSANIIAPTIASADPLAMPPSGDLFTVSGTTSFGNLQGGWAGRQVTLIFSGVLTVFTSTANANSMRLSGNANYTAAVNSTLTLIHNGALWVEKSRSS